MKKDEHRLLRPDLGPGVAKLLFSLSSSPAGVWASCVLALFPGWSDEQSSSSSARALRLIISSIYFSLISSSSSCTNLPGVVSSLKLQDLFTLMDFLLMSLMMVVALAGVLENGREGVRQ